MEKFWCCLVEGTDGGFHFRHATFEDARQEAERLAQLDYVKGKRVYVLEAISYCEVPQPVEWHTFLQY